MAVNPTVGFTPCTCCGHSVAVKRTGEGHHSANCDGCGFRHFWPAGTPCHRKIAGSMTPHKDPFETEPAPAPAADPVKIPKGKVSANPYGLPA